jgi:hypothetical protein
VAERPEPHRDPKTISSFKRTINAAILILVAKDRRPPARVGVFKLGGAVIVAAVVAHLVGLPTHDVLGH